MKKLLLILTLMSGISLQAFDISGRIEEHMAIMPTMDACVKSGDLKATLYRKLSFLGKVFFGCNAPYISKIDGSPEALEIFGIYGRIAAEPRLVLQGASYAAVFGGLIAAINKKMGNTATSNRVALSAAGLAALGIPLVQNYKYGKDKVVPYYDIQTLQRRDNMFGAGHTTGRVFLGLFMAAVGYFGTDYVLDKIINKYKQPVQKSEEEVARMMEQYLVEERPDILMNIILETTASQQTIEQYWQENPEVLRSLYQHAEAFANQKQAVQ